MLGALVLAVALAGGEPAWMTQPLTDADLQGRSAAELRLMRNEVFARHGHTFKAADLVAHFSAQPWYRAQVPDASGRLTPVQRANVDKLRKAEQKAREQEVLAATPEGARTFWAQFRAALVARSEDRITALTRFPMETNLDSGDTITLDRAAFSQRFGDWFPDTAYDALTHAVPQGSGDLYVVYTDVLDEGARVGRTYVFKRTKGGTLRLAGIYWTAG